jgi:hypothetical protein
MKKFVINLPKRHERKEHFLKVNYFLKDVNFIQALDTTNLTLNELLSNGCDTDRYYRNPYTNKKMTKGYIGCTISHYTAWKTCIELNEPIMVFEDDAIVFENLYDENKYTEILKTYNFLYLGRIENQANDVKIVDDDFEIPAYPYNLHAYALTPEAAKILVETDILSRIIPPDEYVPTMLGKLNPIATRALVSDQVVRSIMPSDIFSVTNENYFVDFTTHVITVGTDELLTSKLIHSANQYNITVTNIGLGYQWTGGSTSGPCGGMKINLLKKYIKNLPTYDVILFTDAYDVFYNSSIDTIVNRYLNFNSRIVFSGERFCWPDISLNDKFPYLGERYRFLNSGAFIGQIEELQKLLNDDINDSDDDQLYYQQRFLSGNYDIKLDYKSTIFQSDDARVSIENGKLYNPVTDTNPCIYHGNGGDIAKKTFNSLYNKLMENKNENI